MGEVKLDTELSSYLILVFLLSYLLLTHHLHGTEKTCVLVDNHHHLSKLTLTHLLAHYEIASLEYFYGLSFLESRLSLSFISS